MSYNCAYRSTNVQQLLERTATKRQPMFYKNKTYVRPGYIPNQKTEALPAPVKVSPLTPSPKYLQMEQEIEESVREEQEFDEWMNERFEKQQNTLLEDEYDYVRESCVLLMNPWF